jgi:Flp pilus assembly protein TadG
MRQSISRRRGAIIPLTALSLIALLGFVALAVDLGLLMIARNQCQNAADSAAMAGARALTGDQSTNNNYSGVQPVAVAAAAANSVLGTPIDPSTQLTFTIGDYYYDTTAGTFKISPSSLGVTGDNWNLVQAKVTANQSSFFAKVFGVTSLNAGALATAAHRPRDTAIIVDFSGSMRFESLLAAPYSGTRTTSMNPNSVYPTFGQYAGNSSLLIYSTDQQASSGELIGATNTEVVTSDSNASVISGFYADTTAFGTSTPAFTAASSSYATTPNGDVPLKVSLGGGSSYAHTVSEFLNGSTGQTTRDWRFELDGYGAYSAGAVNTSVSNASDYSAVPFKGYTQGPGYWGKTFMLWPPDPRVPLTTTYFTSTPNNLASPGQIESIVKQFLTDFGYTAADFANTSVTTSTATISTTNPTTILVPATTAANLPSTVPFKIMVGNVSGGVFTGTPEVMSVTAIGATASGTTKWTVSRAQDGTSAFAGVTTTPSATFTTAATSITVNAITGFPTGTLPFNIMVGSVTSGVFTTPEMMTVTAVGGTGNKTWTVTRGVNSTTKIAGTTTMTVGLVQTVGLETAPPLYGTFNAASTSLSATVGKTPSTASAWTGWTASALGTYLTGNVYKPGSSGLVATTDAQYLQTMRLLNRNGGSGMPKNGSGTAMPCDWRARFFTTPGGAPLMDDSALWASGAMNVPSSSTFLINYNAIIDWIKNSGTNPFPNQLRAGGVIYYTAIPSTIDTGTFPPADPNQRFWKEYIDEVLGLMQTGGSGSSPSYSNVAGRTGYGADFAWGTVATSGQPGGWPTSTYLNYTDNPQRPLLRGWFGPLSMVDYLGNYNATDPSNNNGPRLWWPGTVSEAPTYQTKLGIQAALKDTILNHPNDNVSVVFFSSPRSSATATGYYNFVRAPMSRNERLMINALWFAPKVYNNNTEINLYNSSGQNPGDIYTVPRANGGTCYAMPLMLAYNQFSSNSTLISYTANAPSGTAGGLGRNGAAKLLVFETDGMVNTGCSANLVSSSNGTGYYQVRVADANNLSATGTEFPTSVGGVTFSVGASQSQTIATQICADQSAGGFSTTRKPVRIHCIAFGSLFNASNNSSYKTNALQNLATLEVIGGVQQSGATTLAPNKIVTGNFSTRIADLQAAFAGIMQDGIQVTLVSSGSGQP